VVAAVAGRGRGLAAGGHQGQREEQGELAVHGDSPWGTVGETGWGRQRGYRAPALFSCRKATTAAAPRPARCGRWRRR
ncbi:hypothetical protein HMPREF0175_1522, partial [Bifidobacterium longum subsp. longum ATCC 55813]